MKHHEIRQKFLDFFSKHEHKVLDSFPLTLPDDPSLLFVNAGMNPFKDYFLGHKAPKYKRIVNIQRCLRVSGKHNDLEEVGADDTHLTFFEMMGNWSFGDYFKEKAIQLAWEFLTNPKDGLGLPKESLRVTYFGGDKALGLPPDEETKVLWTKYLPKQVQVHPGKESLKIAPWLEPRGIADNFWEMGATGPCGPCTEIYYMPDWRYPDTYGSEMIEIWNLVFMSYNRLPDGRLEELPMKHVDTGMGLERLAMVIEDVRNEEIKAEITKRKHRGNKYLKKESDPDYVFEKDPNYERSVYYPKILSPMLKALDNNLNKDRDKKIGELRAKRISVDHLRAAAAAIAEGVQPANTGAGYVVRRLIRRALRYGYEYLSIRKPYLCELLPAFMETMKSRHPDSRHGYKPLFPALTETDVPIYAIIKGEEEAFLRTLSKGLRRMKALCSSAKKKTITGADAFRLYDTYGFPLDLTRLIAQEKGLKVDEAGYSAELTRQKERSRAASAFVSEVEVSTKTKPSVFIGYEKLSELATIVSAQPMEIKGKKYYGLVLDKTPFYAEAGGQIGDTGIIGVEEAPIMHDFGGNDTETQISVLDTRKVHGQIVHRVAWDSYRRMTDNGRRDVEQVVALVDDRRRAAIAAHHTATHLLHAALRRILEGARNVEQRGSFVGVDHLRFDFSCGVPISKEQIHKIEELVNERIRENIAQEVKLMKLAEAKQLGAMALFGEKYGEEVRVVCFGDFSIELCGGTHVARTGAIGGFKIKSERALSAGVRRIEAVAGEAAFHYISHQLAELSNLRTLLKHPPDAPKALTNFLETHAQTNKQLATLVQQKEQQIQKDLQAQIQPLGKHKASFLCVRLENVLPQALKGIGMALVRTTPRLVAVLVSEETLRAKVHLVVLVDKTLVGQAGIPSAHEWCQTLSQHIKGRGGGQAFLATAGGTYPKGIHALMTEARAWTKKP